MRKTKMEPNPWLATIAVRLPMDQMGDLYHRAHAENTDPSTLVMRIVMEYLEKTRPNSRPTWP